MFVVTIKTSDHLKQLNIVSFIFLCVVPKQNVIMETDTCNFQINYSKTSPATSALLSFKPLVTPYKSQQSFQSTSIAHFT